VEGSTAELHFTMELRHKPLVYAARRSKVQSVDDVVGGREVT